MQISIMTYILCHRETAAFGNPVTHLMLSLQSNVKHEISLGSFCRHFRIISNIYLCTGCQECDCNGHADALLGYCDPDNGTCYCSDNTEGEDCSRCVSGYYGDPRYC